MRDGVPTTTEIAKSFRKVSNAMLDAEAEPADAIDRRSPAVGRTLDRACAQGRPRAPTTPASTPPSRRMDSALKEARLAEVLEQGKKLPPKASLVAEDWLRQVEARQAVDQALADIESQLKSSLGRQSVRGGADPMMRLIAFLLVRACDRRRPALARRPAGHHRRRMAGRHRGNQRVPRLRHPGAADRVAGGVLVAAAAHLVEPGLRRPHPAAASAEARSRCTLERHHRHRCRRSCARLPLRRPGAQGSSATSRSPTCCAPRPRS